VTLIYSQIRRILWQNPSEYHREPCCPWKRPSTAIISILAATLWLWS
jgi:hypothetical protein